MPNFAVSMITIMMIEIIYSIVYTNTLYVILFIKRESKTLRILQYYILHSMFIMINKI